MSLSIKNYFYQSIVLTTVLNKYSTNISIIVGQWIYGWIAWHRLVNNIEKWSFPYEEIQVIKYSIYCILNLGFRHDKVLLLITLLKPGIQVVAGHLKWFLGIYGQSLSLFKVLQFWRVEHIHRSKADCQLAVYPKNHMEWDSKPTDGLQTMTGKDD